MLRQPPPPKGRVRLSVKPTEPVKCDFCGKQFRNFFGMRKHWSSCYSNPNRTPRR